MTTPDTIARLTAEPAGDDVERVDRVAEAIGNVAERYGQPGDLRAARPSQGLLVAQARAAIAALHPTDDLNRTALAENDRSPAETIETGGTAANPIDPTDDLRRTREAEAVGKIIALCEAYAAAAGTSDEDTERPFEDGMTLAGYTLAGMIRDRFLSTVSKEREHG